MRGQELNMILLSGRARAGQRTTCSSELEIRDEKKWQEGV